MSCKIFSNLRKLLKFCFCEKTNNCETAGYEYVQELSKQNKVKPSCQSFWIPIVALIILAALFFIPLHCAAQTTSCCCRDTSRVKQQVTIHFDVDALKLLKEVRYDTTFLKQDIVVSPERIAIQQQSNLWPLVIFRIACAIILLFVIILILKHLVPYWTKIAELNDKQRERMMKLAEERMEFEQLSKKTKISILEKQARANMDETAKDNENKRTIEFKKQEYKSHIADVSLEIVKALNQLNDKDKSAIINQIIHNLNQ